MVRLRHATQAIGDNNPDRQVGVQVWNEDHVVSGDADTILGFDGEGLGQAVSIGDGLNYAAGVLSAAATDDAAAAEAAAASAQTAAAAAAASAVAYPNVAAALGPDIISDVTSTVVGSTTPNTSTAATGKAFGNDVTATATGVLQDVSVRLSATGTGNIEIVAPVAGVQTILAVIPVTVTTLPQTIAMPANTVLPIDGRVFYRRLTGGSLRFVSTGTNVNYTDADAGDSQVTLSSGAATVALSYTALAAPTTLADRVTINEAADAALKADLAVGRSVDPVSGTANGIGTYVFANPVGGDGNVTQLRAYGYNGGTIYVRRFTLSGGTFTQVGTDTSVVVASSASGLQTFALDIDINEGEYLGFYSPANALSVTLNGGADSGGYYRNTSNSTTVSAAALVTAHHFEVGFDVTYQYVNATKVQSIEASLAALQTSTGATSKIFTDGRYLTQWFGKLAIRQQSGAGKAKVMVVGDSWAERLQIVQQLANLLYTAYGNAGGGWISVDSDRTALVAPLNSATFTRSAGWTLFDASDGGAVPTQGCSLDGHLLYATGTSQTASITFTGTNCNIHYSKTTGTFRYQVDGGSWTAVTGDGSNSLGVEAISGLSNASHTISFDQPGNAGTTALRGFYYYTSSGAGVEVQKCGNGSIDSSQIANYVSTYVAPGVQQLAPDVIVYIFNTNDYRHSISTTVAQATMRAFVTAARSVLPNVGFIFVPAANTSDTGAVQTLYRDAMLDVAVTDGHEFYNMYDDFSTWAIENANGQFLDNLHLNDVGGYRVASRLFNKLLKL